MYAAGPALARFSIQKMNILIQGTRSNIVFLWNEP